MELLQQMDPMTVIILIASSAIIVLVLFSTFIRGTLKIAVIVVMLLCIFYFLRQEGLM